MLNRTYDIGIITLGLAGRSLVLNVAEHGHSAAYYAGDGDPDEPWQSHEAGVIGRAASVAELAGRLRRPRILLLLLPAGFDVDTTIHDLLPHLEPDDVLIDASNSHFADTNLRGEALAQLGIRFLGLGVSGGEPGGHRGPSLMASGSLEAFDAVRPILESVAASADGRPCAGYLGIGSSGHYVKMVLDGIEFGLMRLIAETYDLMKWGMALTDDELHNVYEVWNEGELNCYLLEVTAHMFAQPGELTGKPLINTVFDEASQAGTGRWAAQDAMDLEVPAPTISLAVAMRDLSLLKSQRVQAGQVLMGPERSFHGNLNRILAQARNALYASMIIVFAQGLAQLGAASARYGYDLDPSEVVRIWQGGSIIRAALLRKIRIAFRTRPDLPNLLLDGQLGWEVMARQADLRAVVRTAVGLGISVPALASCLGYYDAYRSTWSPANLIAAQSDYLDLEPYERPDTKARFRRKWNGQ